MSNRSAPTATTAARSRSAWTGRSATAPPAGRAGRPVGGAGRPPTGPLPVDGAPPDGSRRGPPEGQRAAGRADRPPPARLPAAGLVAGLGRPRLPIPVPHPARRTPLRRRPAGG